MYRFAFVCTYLFFQTITQAGVTFAADSVAPVTSATPAASTTRPKPQSAEFLDAFKMEDISGVRAPQGANLVLMNFIPISPTAGFDPMLDIGKIKVKWTKVSGPDLPIKDADSAKASVKIPTDLAPTEIVYRVTMSNAKSTKTGDVKIHVVPPQSHPRLKRTTGY